MDARTAQGPEKSFLSILSLTELPVLLQYPVSKVHLKMSHHKCAVIQSEAYFSKVEGDLLFGCRVPQSLP
jgi:hypothetical protein